MLATGLYRHVLLRIWKIFTCSCPSPKSSIAASSSNGFCRSCLEAIVYHNKQSNGMTRSDMSFKKSCSITDYQYQPLHLPQPINGLIICTHTIYIVLFGVVHSNRDRSHQPARQALLSKEKRQKVQCEARLFAVSQRRKEKNQKQKAEKELSMQPPKQQVSKRPRNKLRK